MTTGRKALQLVYRLGSSAVSETFFRSVHAFTPSRIGYPALRRDRWTGFGSDGPCGLGFYRGVAALNAQAVDKMRWRKDQSSRSIKLSDKRLKADPT
jgi:hypothetical protein